MTPQQKASQALDRFYSEFSRVADNKYKIGSGVVAQDGEGYFARIPTGLDLDSKEAQAFPASINGVRVKYEHMALR